MDLNAFLRLVFLEKNDITFGVITGLLLIVLIWLLIRSVMAEKSGAAAGQDGSMALDSSSINVVIEGALKKALGDPAAAAAVAAAAGASAGAGGEVSADAKELKKALNEREAKISALMSDLEAVKGAMEKSGGATAGGGEDMSVLQAKIKELQSKLAEYEIIEDDIADLSLYKEENKKLKDEVEKLRAAVETAKSQVQAAQVATDPAPLVDAVQAAQAAVVSAAPTPAPTTASAPGAPVAAAAPAVAPVSPAPAPTPQAARSAPEPFKLDTNDDVMGEFAQALAGAAPKALDSALISGTEVADPKAAIDALFSAPAAPAQLETPATAVAAEAPTDPFGTLDTEKMLAEVASMKEAAVDTSTSVLDEQLDTDRLMAEMGMSETAPTPAPVAATVAASAAAPVAAAPAAPAPAPAAVPVEKPDISESVLPVDDLLAEFKDTELLKGTKG